MRNLPPYLYKVFSDLGRSFQQSRNAAYSLFFPWRCVLCEELQPYVDVVCESCRKRLPRITRRWCRICGAPFSEHWRVKICPDCKLQRPKLTRIRSVFLYEGRVIQMIHEMKFAKRARFARYFSEEMYLFFLQHFARRADVIVPVPLHRSREWQRTFNQARLMAEHLSKLSGIPVKNCLRRTRNTISQTFLSGQARRKNLEGAFCVKQNIDLPKSVLLIDDVITTGATLEACSVLLRKAGVRKIYGLTVARAMLKP
jgi:ComF family protein